MPYPVFHASEPPPTRNAPALPASALSRARTLEHVALSARDMHGWTGPTVVFFLNVAGTETKTGGGYAAHLAFRKSSAVRTIFEKGADEIRVAGKCFGRGLMLVDVSGVSGGAIHGLNAPAAVFFNATGKVVHVIPPGEDMNETAILAGMMAAHEPQSLQHKLSLGNQTIQAVKRNASLRDLLDAKQVALGNAEEAARSTILQEIAGIESEIARLDRMIADFETLLVPAQ